MKDLHVWALVDTLAPMEDRRIKIVATGEEIKYGTADEHIYLGTVVTSSGLVFHVFERLKKKPKKGRSRS